MSPANYVLSAAVRCVLCDVQIKTASWLSGVSTASMGKFDKRLAGEKEGERKLPGECGSCPT